MATQYFINPVDAPPNRIPCDISVREDGAKVIRFPNGALLTDDFIRRAIGKIAPQMTEDRAEKREGFIMLPSEQPVSAVLNEIILFKDGTFSIVGMTF